jgi:hypothetical protein
MLVQEFESQTQDAVGELIGLQVPELVAEGTERHNGLGHRSMTASAADVVEVLPNEFPGVA